jgi:predicted small lipoprotein YifL
MKFSQLLLLLIVSSVLAGCGQPGPLYLPSKAPPVNIEPSPKPDQKTNNAN